MYFTDNHELSWNRFQILIRRQPHHIRSTLRETVSQTPPGRGWKEIIVKIAKPIRGGGDYTGTKKYPIPHSVDFLPPSFLSWMMKSPAHTIEREPSNFYLLDSSGNYYSSSSASRSSTPSLPSDLPRRRGCRVPASGYYITS